MYRFSLVIVSLFGICLSCSSSPRQGGTEPTSEPAPSPTASPVSIVKPCPKEQTLNTAAGEIRINDLVEDTVNPPHYYEITMNGKSVNKETSYCTLIDRHFGDVKGKAVVLVSQRTHNGSLVDSRNNPIGPDTKYKLIALNPDGSFWLSKSFGNGAPYLEAVVESEKLVIRFQDAYLAGSDRYDMGREETWVYQDGKLSRMPNKH